jgi:hypothetical protein
VIVEMQVEQGAVHIEKHAVDFVPWDHNLCNINCLGGYVSRYDPGDCPRRHERRAKERLIQLVIPVKAVIQ